MAFLRQKCLRRFDEVVAEVTGNSSVRHLAPVDIEAVAEVGIPVEDSHVGPHAERHHDGVPTDDTAPDHHHFGRHDTGDAART